MVAALQILAEGREWQQLAKQLATVKGYKQIKVCHMVLKHLQQVLALTPVTAPTCGRSQWTAPVTADDVEDGVEGAGGAPEAAKQRHHISVLEAEARTFLSVMCEERLMPTYWLNEVRRAAFTGYYLMHGVLHRSVHGQLLVILVYGVVQFRTFTAQELHNCSGALPQ